MLQPHDHAALLAVLTEAIQASPRGSVWQTAHQAIYGHRARREAWESLSGTERNALLAEARQRATGRPA